MKLESFQSKSSLQRQYPLFSPLSEWKSNQKEQTPQPDTWVQLLELPNPYSHDEALLLCQHSEREWVAWIPEHGEAVLRDSQFFLASS